MCQADEQDVSHVIRRSKRTWLNFLLTNTSNRYAIDANLNCVLLKGTKDLGSLTVIIDAHNIEHI